jgi:RNA-binding protein
MKSSKSLRGFQRRHLRKLAHPLRPIVHIGEAGMAAPVIAALDQALTDHELVKVRLHGPDDKKGLARNLAEASGAELCGLVGHTVILYRRNEDAPRIVFPDRE